MNRLIIIGNGFDLAHGLPTGYCDFIEDYWRNVIETIRREKKYNDIFFKADISAINNRAYAKGELEMNVKNYDSLFTFFNQYRNYGASFSFDNELFRTISNQTSVNNWVDIENIYYEILKAKAKSINNRHSYNHDVKRLNEDFNQIKELLENYLQEKVLKAHQYKIPTMLEKQYNQIYEKLRAISIFNNENTILNQFTKNEDVYKIKDFFEKEKKGDLIKSKLYFLNFNYTNTVDLLYKPFLQNEKTEVYMNYIHGEIGNKKENKINFGFGDEMDEDYKSIENINDNEYLKNFKSFQYLQNSNYTNLLNFIDSEEFQVVIIGHSCGLSDRTLLNTIFEHKFCRSIKVVYHQIKDENGQIVKDNYTEIVQNISRHFNKKALMRERIVNKLMSEALPQMRLPKTGELFF